MTDSPRKHAVVMIPTYNEKDNIADLIGEILRLPHPYDVSVVVADDNSPDGTGRIVEDMSRENPRVHVLIRKKRRGRGAGGIDGFKMALALNPDCVIEMDGDFSHQPKFIPALIAGLDSFDLVLGSRFVKGGKDVNRSLVRRIITRMVRIFIGRQFRLPVKDVSSGFRCFRREVLEAVDLDDLISVGPSVVLEILYKTSLLGFRIGEVPIAFVDRTRGKTKLSLLTLIETLIMAMKFKKLYPRPEAGKS